MALFAHYTMETATTQDVFDESGNGYDMSITSCTQTTDKRYRGSYSLHFDGVGSKMSNASLGFTASATWSFSLFIWSEKDGTTTALFGKDDGGVGGWPGGVIENNNKFTLFDSAITTIGSVAISNLLERWHQIGGTYNNGQIYLYIDGEQNGPYTKTTTMDFVSWSTFLDVGAGYQGQIQGYLDDIRIYDSVLSAGEMKDLWENVTLKGLIKSSTHRPFRNILMKRRESNGEYETTWQTISNSRIKKFGSVDKGTDVVVQNHFASSGFNFQAVNNDGFFSDITDDKSFFYDKLSRVRTLVSVESGYKSDNGVSYPTTGTLFVGLLKEDMAYTHDNTIKFKADHLDKIFKEFPADRVVGLGATQTAKSIIEKIRDHTTGSGSDIYYFQKFITSGGWIITSTTRTYNMATSTHLEGMSVWDLMKGLAEAENRMMFITREGDFRFIEKDPTATSSYHFSGIGDTDLTYGRNILKQIAVDDDIRNVYNRVRIKYAEGTTSGADLYIIKNESWDWGDSSSSFKYGIRTYELNNDFMGATTVSNAAEDIFSEFQYAKQVVKLQTKFVPQLDVLDRINITYETQVRTGDALWGTAKFDEDIWGGRTGKNISVDGDYKLTRVNHKLANFTSNLVAREI